MGPRDLANGTVELARRDIKTKEVVSLDGIDVFVANLLEEIQNSLFQRALSFRKENCFEVNNWDEFLEVINNKQGFAFAHWDGTNETESKIKELTKATIRCIPMDNMQEDGVCVFTGNPSKQRVVFAKSY
jgi:prolyl-tRNA synthetase